LGGTISAGGFFLVGSAVGGAWPTAGKASAVTKAESKDKRSSDLSMEKKNGGPDSILDSLPRAQTE
jgi:hypothetical protein